MCCQSNQSVIFDMTDHLFLVSKDVMWLESIPLYHALILKNANLNSAFFLKKEFSDNDID